MHFQLRATLGLQALPIVFGGNVHLAVVGRLAILIRHFQEDQIGELLQIIAIAHAVVAQRGAETPDLGNDGCGCVHVRAFLLLSVHGFFRLDARQQCRSRFVVRVLRHQLAGEGFLQDGLAQGFGLLQGSGDGLVEIGQSRKVFQFDDS